MFLSHLNQFQFPSITFVGRKLLLTLVAIALTVHILAPFPSAQTRAETLTAQAMDPPSKPQSTLQTKTRHLELLRRAVVWAAPGVDVAEITSGRIQKVAFVDSDRYFDEKLGINRLVEVAKRVRPELNEWTVSLERTRQKYEALYARLAQLPLGGCPDVEKWEEDLEKLKAEYKHQGDAANALLKRSITYAASPIQVELDVALNDYAASNGLSLILDVAKLPKAVAFVQPRLDITEAFCRGFNSGNYPVLDLPEPRVSFVNTGAFINEASGIRVLLEGLRAVDREFQPRRDELDNLYADIQLHVSELKKTTGPMADLDRRNVWVVQLEKLNQRYPRLSSKLESEYSLRRREIGDPIIVRIQQAMRDFINQRGDTLVFDLQVIGGSNSELDFTNAFIAEFNRLEPLSAPAK